MGQHEYAEGEYDRDQAKGSPHPLPFQHMLNPEDLSLSSDLCQINGAHGGVLSEQPGSRPDTTTAA